ncbi:MAG TPA: hypothetical protein H9851_00140 [Candidatus Borkfalkia faecavium]|uniref:Uncharacterized protein n=1 Tax=Candidatus Borkfalkia faecavium TaxID=2838508 RepID=A0A9D1W0N4_9FIRM|nr:hypothetical protein [Candidatus Borkfalkia faecavium]
MKAFRIAVIVIAAISALLTILFCCGDPDPGLLILPMLAILLSIFFATTIVCLLIQIAINTKK